MTGQETDGIEVITNPLTGERITRLDATAGSDILRAEVTVAPQKAILPLHIHARSEEHWAVVAGRLGTRVGTEVRTLGPGERAAVPPGVPHTWWNDGPSEVRFHLEVLHPLQMESAFAALAGMARSGKALVIHRRLIPLAIVEAALLLCATDSYVAEPPIPLWLQRVTFRGLVVVAQRLGYRPDLARYRALASGRRDA